MSDYGSITFVPSVHFSATHRRRVRDTIRDVEPDLVAVELDEHRFERLEGANPSALSHELPPPTAAAYAALRAIQRTVVRLYGLDPTKTDMETAIETAAELEAAVALIDEPLSETVATLSRRVGLETLPNALIRAQSLDPAEYTGRLEVLVRSPASIDHGDDVQPAIDHLRRLLPEIAEVVIDRRDRAMAERLHRLRREGHDVVAVIGAGHHNGIRRVLDELEADDAAVDATVPIRRPSREVTRIPIE